MAFSTGPVNAQEILVVERGRVILLGENKQGAVQSADKPRDERRPRVVEACEFPPWSFEMNDGAFRLISLGRVPGERIESRFSGVGRNQVDTSQTFVLKTPVDQPGRFRVVVRGDIKDRAGHERAEVGLDQVVVQRGLVKIWSKTKKVGFDVVGIRPPDVAHRFQELELPPHRLGVAVRLIEKNPNRFRPSYCVAEFEQDVLVQGRDIEGTDSCLVDGGEDSLNDQPTRNAQVLPRHNVYDIGRGYLAARGAESLTVKLRLARVAKEQRPCHVEHRSSATTRNSGT